MQYFDGQQWTGERRPVEPAPPAFAPPAFAPPPALAPSSATPWQPPEWQPPPPPAQPRRRRGRLVIAATAAVVVAAGLTAWLVWPSEPTLTYHGRRIADPGAVLTAAESSVHALVTTRHGVDSAATRCYFTEQRKAGSGSKKTDVDALLRCGPVLFVDGDRAKTYLSIPLTSAPDSGSKVTLTPGVTPRSND
ncbi:MAG: hypothetical protein QOH14_2736, partial [Pseudonocardiales bacterium]|nr:hypothetical protein [Pseudonocardiales bacterium]